MSSKNHLVVIYLTVWAVYSNITQSQNRSVCVLLILY